MTQTRKVIVIGGGIAGMTVAHELAKANARSEGLNFDVHVYEAEDHLGGKAENQFFEPGEPPGRFPGEHGFRFFPHFYRHITQTLREIPRDGGARSVFDMLRESKYAAIVHDGEAHRIHRATPALNVLSALTGVFRDLDVDPADVARFAWDMLRFATSCEARRLAEYESQSWEDYLDLNGYSAHFARLLRSIPSNLSAMKAEHGSARTIGNTAMQVLFDYEPEADAPADAVLAGPTRLSFLDPFQQHLESFDCVKLHLGTRVEALGYQPGRRFLDGVQVVTSGGPKTIQGDYYVLAVPIERAVKLITKDMRDDDVGLANLHTLAHQGGGRETTAPMVGVQFFLDRDVQIVAGHATLPYSEWALTVVSQQQFWERSLAEITGNPEVEGSISAIISEWNTPGTTGKSAAECTSSDELADEVWRQLKRELPDTFRDHYVLTRHVDQRVKYDAAGARATTPLLIHPTDSHHLRPHARTTISNMVLAADYVRTLTDLASMEGADEAARTAVGAILRDEGVDPVHWPRIVPLKESPLFTPAKDMDRVLFDMGLPHPMQDGGNKAAVDWALTSGVLPEIRPELLERERHARLLQQLDAARSLQPRTSASCEAWSEVFATLGPS